MKLFIDTANIDEIREANSWGILSGVTTNPTLAAREGLDFRSAIKQIASLVDGPVSAEAVSLVRDEIVAEARELAALAKNVVIKIPVGAEGLAATRTLTRENIAVNMTLVFTVNQALLAAAAGASYVSPFIGRLDDIGHEGTALLADMMQAYGNYGIKTQVIAASIRHPQHVTEAALIGVDIATVPFGVLKRMMEHPLTEKGIARFLSDWDKLQRRVKTRLTVEDQPVSVPVADGGSDSLQLLKKRKV